MTAPDKKVASEKPSSFAIFAFALGLIALSALAWQWLDTKQRFSQLEQSITRHLEQSNANNQQSLALSKSADERSVEATAKTVLLEQKLAESHSQLEALQTLYQELANTREERVIAEVEQLIVIANQQLQLASNVKPALLALQSADGRLQHLDTPRAIQLRKAIANDIARLQNLPLIDIADINLKLENLISEVDKLPLVSRRLAAPNAASLPDTATSTIHKLAQEIWQDIKSMIRLERIDHPEPPLLAPNQVFFLRESIKLRLLTARVALLQRDEATYRADLSAAEQWIKNYFDVQETATKNTLMNIEGLLASDIVIQLPNMSESLNLIGQYKLALERDK